MYPKRAFDRLLNPRNENDFQPDLTIAARAMQAESHHNFKQRARQ
jgi:hypothetical protein